VKYGKKLKNLKFYAMTGGFLVIALLFEIFIAKFLR